MSIKATGKIRTIGTVTEKMVYFVRHGQSEGNVTPVFQPLDSPLNENGRAQAAKIAERATRIPFESLISSPLPRTRETAEFIARATGKSIEFSELFVERVKPSSLSGKPYTDDEANALWNEWENSLFSPGMRVGDGENYDDLIARVDEALQFLEGRAESNILVVTHGFFLRTIVARVLFGNLLTGPAYRAFQSHIHTENAGLTVLRFGSSYEGSGWSLWVYNDHAHLG